MKILILDDDLNRHRQFKIKFIGNIITPVYTSEEAINALQEDTYHSILLDHDLGGEQMVKSGDGTGFQVSKWMAENLKEETMPNGIYLHSLNPIGRKNMKDVLESSSIITCPIYECPFLWVSK